MDVCVNKCEIYKALRLNIDSNYERSPSAYMRESVCVCVHELKQRAASLSTSRLRSMNESETVSSHARVLMAGLEIIELSGMCFFAFILSAIPQHSVDIYRIPNVHCRTARPFLTRLLSSQHRLFSFVPFQTLLLRREGWYWCE